MRFSKSLILNSIFSFILFIFLHLACFGNIISDRYLELLQEEKIIERSKEIHEDSKFTLKDYINEGISNNHAIKSAFYEWKAYYQKISSEFALPNPELEYMTVIDSNDNMSENTFSLKQMIPFGDKLWIKKQMAFLQSEIAYYKYRNAKLNYLRRINNLYYEYAYLNKALIAAKENIKLLNNIESVLRAKYSSGTAKNQDLLKIQVELTVLENELKSLSDMQHPLLISINSLLNLQVKISNFNLDESLDNVFNEDYLLATNDIISKLKQSPLILELGKKTEMQKENIKLAKRGFIPDLKLGVSKKENNNDELAFTLSLDIPIWYGRIKAEIDSAESSFIATENEFFNMNNELYSEAEMINYKIRDSFRQLKLYKESLIPKALQTLNAIKVAYESGEMDFMSLIDAQRVLYNFQLAYYRHNANFYQQVSELKSLIGDISI